MAFLAKKKKEQIYLQTWHGTPLKKMGYDQSKRPTRYEQDRLRKQTEIWDYFISSNKHSSDIFRRAFRYTGDIIETGYPRNDILINQPGDTIVKVQSNLSIPIDKKVVLFAPTFRDWDLNSFQTTLSDIKKLSKSIDENTVILLRLHYLLADKIEQLELPENILNASNYGDIQELYLISDVLITDYSSVMFDYALLKRPIILYCYDLEEYETRRGMYLDLHEVGPGPVCKDLEQVIEYLKEPEKLKKYEEKLELFNQEYGSMDDGLAAKRVIEKVFN